MKLLNIYHSVDKIIDSENLIFLTPVVKDDIFNDYRRIFPGRIFLKSDRQSPPVFKEISGDKTVGLPFFKTTRTILIVFPETCYEDLQQVVSLPFIAVFGEIDTQGGQDFFAFWEILRSKSRFINFELAGQSTARYLYWEKRESRIELSIVVPVYNVEKYLRQCLNSLVDWKADYIEIIAINDSSPDNCLDILNEYSTKDKRVKVFTQLNGGCAAARQKGLELASGRYVGFVDSDDFINPDMFKKLLKAALSGNYDVAYCGYNKFYEDELIQCEIINEPCLEKPYTDGIYNKKAVLELSVRSDVAIWRGIYKKSFLTDQDIRFMTNIKMYDDLPFQKEIFLKAHSFISIPDHLYYYRLGRIGQDVACTDERLHVHFEIFNHLERVFENEKSIEARKFLRKIKMDTHRYALSKIDDQYLIEYRRKAIKDLKNNSSFADKIRLSCKTLLRKRF